MAKTRTRKRTTTRTTSPARKPATVVDLRKPLPTRRPTPTGPYSATEQAAARAILASAMARLPIPVLAWHGPEAELSDGTLVAHTDQRLPAFTTRTRPPEFTAAIPCPRGGTHQHTIHSAEGLTQARAETAACQDLHGASPDQHDALTHGITRTGRPEPAVSPLGEGLRRAQAATHDTQPLALDDIAAGLAERPKEHPQP